MSWLLDVNALLALAFEGHTCHPRLMRWYASLIVTEAELVTCAITEIGFVRVSLQAGLEGNVTDAVDTLVGLKKSSRIPFRLVPDTLGADCLPTYVSGARQVTDGHLLELAKAHQLWLATLDKGIPGAFQIP